MAKYFPELVKPLIERLTNEDIKIPPKTEVEIYQFDRQDTPEYYLDLLNPTFNPTMLYELEKLFETNFFNIKEKKGKIVLELQLPSDFKDNPQTVSLTQIL